MFKKRFLALLLILTTTLPTQSFALNNTNECADIVLLNSNSYVKYESNTNSLNIRTKPLASSMILGKINKGDIVNVLEIKNSWAKVSYKNNIGYINSKYLNKLSNETSKYIVTTNNLNIRADKSTNSKTISKFKNNTIIDVYSISNGWGKILYNNKICYVSSKFIKKYTTPNESINSSNTNNNPNINNTPNQYNSTTAPSTSQYTVITNSLNIRSKGNNNSTVLGKLKYGDVINITNVSNGWATFKYKNKTAYVSSAYICKLVENSEQNNYLVLVNKQNSLSSSYVPNDLITVNVKTKSGIASSTKQMRKEPAKELEKMFSDAKKENINLLLYSGYRSFSTQKEIYESKVKAQGQKNADLVSAKAGLSEHQTGLAVDVVSSDYTNITTGFAKTKASNWLVKNAANYGFIIRYQNGKTNITGYSFEPWHLRYVGVEAAREISSQNLTLEEYLQKK